MDISKLPRMSQTPSPHQAAESEPKADATADPLGGPQQRPATAASPDVVPGSGAEAFVSAGIGVILVLIGFRFVRYLVASLMGRPFNTGVVWHAGPKSGQPATYWELTGYTALNEMAICLFGFALILEAVILLAVNMRPARQSWLVAFALLVAVLATALNVVVAGLLLGIGVLPLVSLLAIVFGGWMIFYQWRLLGSVRAAGRS